MIWILAILGLVLAYLLVNLAAAWFSLHPFRVPLYISPGLMGFPQEKIELQVDGLVLSGWHSGHPEPKGIIVAVHGYVMNRCEWVPLLPLLHKEGWSCLFVDFRGQGASAGALCTLGDHERRDVAAMLDWAQARYPGLPVVLLGSSMGAAAAVFAAAEDPSRISGMILDGAYSDLHHAGNGWWKMVGGNWLDAAFKLALPIGSLLTGMKARDLSVVKALARLQGKPMLLAYGTCDPIVPRPCAEEVAAAAGPSAEVVWFEGAGHGHGRFREPGRYHEACLRLLRRASGSSEPPAL